jgi:hypothetical protein
LSIIVLPCRIRHDPFVTPSDVSLEYSSLSSQLVTSNRTCRAKLPIP